MIDMAFGIGDKNGNLLFNLPKDMKHFRKETTGKTVVMGRKTWDSLPVKPLRDRENCILTRNLDFNPSLDGATVVNSIEEVLEMSKEQDVYIVGGAEIYKQFMEHADELIITHVHTVNLDARTFFPDFAMDKWKPVSLTRVEPDHKHVSSFAITRYSRIS